MTNDNEATAAPHRARSHRRAASGKKPPPRSIGQDATASQHRARRHSRAVSDQLHPNLAPMTFTLILRISPPPISLSFNFSFQLLDWPVSSDSLNISPRARWVVCPLGCTRGHGRRFIYPRRVRDERKKIPCGNCRFSAVWPLGQQREEQGDLFIFFARSASHQPVSKAIPKH